MTATLNGWIGIPRSLLAADWYTQADAFTRALWLHLMLSASFRTATTRTGLTLNPGQLVTSWPALALAMKAHPSKVRRAAAFLGKAGEATFKPTGRPTYTGTVVTLERWALYASDTAQPTDHPTAEPTDRLSEGRQDRKNTTPPVGENYEPPHRRALNDFLRRSRESMQELREVRARERGEVVN